MEMFKEEKAIKQTDQGRVLLVRHTVSGNRYILREYRGSGQVWRRLLTVSCPYLPEVYDVTERDGTVTVLEEYIPGDDLADLLQSALLTPKQAKRTALQLAQALWVLHGLGAVHRDVKPENVILCEDRAVLVDFDASRLVKPEASSDTQVLGTIGYAPPEQYGIGQTDPRSDIYALGVLLNICLTGEHPSQRLAPGRYGRIVRKCTMINPKQRYRSAKELMEALL